MKAKKEVVPLSLIVLIFALILNVNISIDRYKTTKEIQSTANYIEIEDQLITDNIYLVTKEEPEEINEILEVEPIVYDGLTMDELTNKLNNSLNSTISNKGYLIASYSLEKGVDPYMALAIILQETGCKWNCSYVVNACNNVGGQVGSGCGGYSYFNTLDEGIMAFIDNLYKNYISLGLTTPETINPKYAADPNWSVNVNAYIEQIKAQ